MGMPIPALTPISTASKEADRAFRSNTHGLSNLLRRRTGKPGRAVVIVDEVEEGILKQSKDGTQYYPAFSGVLNALLSVHSEAGFLVPIVCGKRPESLETGVFTEIFLKPMTPEECAEMIRGIGRAMGIEWSSSTLQTIYAATGGHPYIARSLCSLIWQDRKPDQFQFHNRDLPASRYKYLQSRDNYPQKLLERKLLTGRMKSSFWKTSRTGRVGLRTRSRSWQWQILTNEHCRQQLSCLAQYGLVMTDGQTISINGEVIRSWLVARGDER